MTSGRAAGMQRREALAAIAACRGPARPERRRQRAAVAAEPSTAASDDRSATSEAAPSEDLLGESLTFGERLADKVAGFGGSWTFILCFIAVLAAWVVLNTGILIRWNDQFDPYPYILLNLFLSMLAALQAPVIMMSQNRQAAKDRLQARHDYEINLRAEIEIAALHDKLDALRIGEVHDAVERLEQQVRALARREGG